MTGNMFYTLPENVASHVVPDGSYEDWRNAFAGVETWFRNPANGWQNQWLRKPERVAQLVSGRVPDWITW